MPARLSVAPVAAAESIAGHSRSMFDSIFTPSSSAGTEASTLANASARSARKSQISSPESGTTLNASPERITVGTTLSRSGPPGRCSSLTVIAAQASALEDSAQSRGWWLPGVACAAQYPWQPPWPSRLTPTAARHSRIVT